MSGVLSDAAQLALPLAKHPTLSPARLVADHLAAPSRAAADRCWRDLTRSLHRTLVRRGLTPAEARAAISDLGAECRAHLAARAS